VGLIACFWVGYVAIFFVVGSSKGIVPAAWQDLYSGVLGSVALVGFTYPFVRHERGRLHAAGIGFDRGSVGRLVVGLLLGVAIYAGIALLVALISGPITFAPAAEAPEWGGAAVVVASFLSLSALEEVGFRGHPLRALEDPLGPVVAQVVVAVAFGGSHLLYGWPASAVLLGVIPSGLLFGAAAKASPGLAFPIGVHAALNLAAWSVGSKETPGPWTIVLADGTAERVAAVAPWISFGVTLVTAALLAWRRESVMKVLSSASPRS
jgi:membrane protease YdiL (CAAX protease family)